MYIHTHIYLYIHIYIYYTIKVVILSNYIYFKYCTIHSPGIALGTAIRTTMESLFEFQKGKETFLFSQTSRPDLVYTQPPIE